MGAIASGGILVLNDEIIRQFGITERMIRAVVAEEEHELVRRELEYRHGRDPLDISRRTVILVDDGLATGARMRAAARALRKKHPARIVVAVPVGAAETRGQFQIEADEVVCGKCPNDLTAIGPSYEDFTQTTDKEVCELLAGASQVVH
ncbi:MAG TPA: phosphoribosyltransferase family protein [Verrucomicrobiae bacterium]|jgi:putative phosphoribosyl transferase|nr:phosphoribosyltransferase family protein [Verrucomicrobiae bacterium]